MSEKPPPRILVVDDEIELMNALCEGLADHRYAATGAVSGVEALKLLGQGEFDLLLSDLMMPGMDGIQLIREAQKLDSALVCIIMTGQGTIPTAIEAIRNGAFDYVLKPFKLASLLPVLGRALEVYRLRAENRRLRQLVGHLTFESPRYSLVGSSLAMQRVVKLIEKVAPTEATVLVRGASGTGKELVARALHGNSVRTDHPLVTINCAALQESLLESELFGHEKGSFTGASQAKRGLIEVAEGGTLFIDEVAEMAPSMQAKLLRVLEDGHYRRVGGTHEHRANVRIIAATNKPLEEDQKAGRFREDLFFRLNVFSIVLPPLCERRTDIPELIEHFLSTRQIGGRRCLVDPDALNVLMEYHWPGNVRELANVLERAQILAENALITVDDLPEAMLSTPGHDIPPSESLDGLTLRQMERRQVQSALEQAKGNKVHAARALGISRRALYRLIDKYRLESTEPG